MTRQTGSHARSARLPLVLKQARPLHFFNRQGETQTLMGASKVVERMKEGHPQSQCFQPFGSAQLP